MVNIGVILVQLSGVCNGFNRLNMIKIKLYSFMASGYATFLHLGIFKEHTYKYIQFLLHI